MMNQSIEEVEEQQQQKTLRKDNLITKKDRLVNDENNLTKKLYQLKSNLTEAEKALLTAQQDSNRFLELVRSESRLYHSLLKLRITVSIIILIPTLSENQWYAY
jgi:hypothetical protein